MDRIKQLRWSRSLGIGSAIFAAGTVGGVLDWFDLVAGLSKEGALTAGFVWFAFRLLTKVYG